ncbi:6052_t:CDS:1, partial [Paraglomus brasilianum]
SEKGWLRIKWLVVRIAWKKQEILETHAVRRIYGSGKTLKIKCYASGNDIMDSLLSESKLEE